MRPEQGSPKRPCPICKRPVLEGEVTAPFCGPRCRSADLDRWLSESYRIPGEPVEPGDFHTPEDS